MKARSWLQRRKQIVSTLEMETINLALLCFERLDCRFQRFDFFLLSFDRLDQ